MVGGMEWLVDVADEVGQNPDGELLVRLGFLGVSKNVSVTRDLCRGAGSIRTVFAVGFLTADWNVVVVPFARSWDLHIEPILVVIEIQTEGRQVGGSHNRLDFRAGLRQQLSCDESYDAMPLRSPGHGVGDRTGSHEADQNGNDSYGLQVSDASRSRSGQHLLASPIAPNTTPQEHATLRR